MVRATQACSERVLACSLREYLRLRHDEHVALQMRVCEQTSPLQTAGSFIQEACSHSFPHLLTALVNTSAVKREIAGFCDTGAAEVPPPAAPRRPRRKGHPAAPPWSPGCTPQLAARSGLSAPCREAALEVGHRDVVGVSAAVLAD